MMIPMAHFKLQFVVPIVLMTLLAGVIEAARTPPGIANNPSNAVCKDPGYKQCYNLVHVCPKICPDSCTVHCQSCKPICGPEDIPPPQQGGGGDDDGKGKGKGDDQHDDGKGKGDGGNDGKGKGKGDGNDDGKGKGDGNDDGKGKGKGKGDDHDHAPPVTPTPSPPTPSTPYPPPTIPTQPPPTPSTPTPPTPSIPSYPPPTQPPSTPSPTPPTTPYPPPSSPTPSTPSPTPSTPSTTPPSTPSTPSPTPSTPSQPTPSPPSSETAPATASCRNDNYPQCYKLVHKCPRACSGGCEVDCVTCKPVCKCDKPGAVCQDPRFVGGDGITFYFHGKKDRDFCLVSDSNLHINAHFIGKRTQNMKRDFTWVQSIAILFENHQLFIGALKTATWDDSVDRLAISFNGEPVSVPQAEGVRWQQSTNVSITRADETNNVIVEVAGKFKITAKVVPITEEESRIHNYGIIKEDCFAHLDIGFKFYSLSDKVNGVLGQTYRPGYVTRVNMGANMPVMGGEREFATSSLFAADCAVARFSGSNNGDDSMNVLELPSLSCASGIDGKGVVCKR